MKRCIKYIIVLFIVVIFSISIITVLDLLNNTNEVEEHYISYVEPTTKETTIITNMFYVDLKGAVKKPGVYKVKQGTIVNELIELAGGLTKNAYTDNINLSKKLTEESVIYIYTVSEIKKLNNTTTTSSVKYDSYDLEVTTNTTSLNNTSKININTASLNELTSLTGIGESKALAIVAYRTESPFKSIEEIKNISGIGESLYAKIKDNITI
jgi:competence protein ComEA